MKDLKLKNLNLLLEESRYIIEFLARKRGVNNYKRKSNDELLHTLKEFEKYEQKMKSKNKERIEVIREQSKELGYKLSKGELKNIKKNLYQIENKKGFLE